jgi:leucyl aminopeptidase
MAETVQIDFTALKDAGGATKGRGAKASGGALVVLAGSDLAMSAETQAILGDAADLVKRAAATAKFKGAGGSALDILAPAGLAFDRLMVIGTAKKPAKDAAKSAAPAAPDYVSLGGAIMGKIGGFPRVTVVFDLAEAPASPGAAAADAMLGMRLRAYKFDLYKTKKNDDDV